MGRIQILSIDVIEKIAAGEVIERPVSVVKELVENSLDAGATEIKVYVERGGKRLIKVVDNGHGISKDDLELCSLRYSTSKISSTEDLQKITTLGFRGEALASIATVSELTIASRTARDEYGIMVKYDAHGKIIESNKKPIAMGRGTIVTVNNLFSRFPARLKFMRSDDIEYSHILELIKRYSLSNENVSFYLFKDGKEVFHSYKGPLIEKISHVYGIEIVENLIPVLYNNELMKMRGYISKVGYTRKTKDYQAIFVNGRFVRSKEIEDAVSKGYPKLFLNRYPVFVIKLEIPPRYIDVNVHPTKKIIKFVKEGVVIRFISEGVKKSILSKDSVLSVNIKSQSTPSQPGIIQSKGTRSNIVQPEFSKGTQKLLEHAQLELAEQSVRNNVETVGQTVKSQKQKPIQQKCPTLKILGQMNLTYIVCEGKDGIYIIDQHAAEERINYEKYLKQLKNRSIDVQELVVPTLFAPNDKEKEVITKHHALLKRYGYLVEEYGTNMFALKTVPAVFGNVLPLNVFRDVIDEIASMKHKTIIDETVDKRIATRSCKASVKAGDRLTLPQMDRILSTLNECDNPFTCPHGRPVMIKLSWKELEKRFKRRD